MYIIDQTTHTEINLKELFLLRPDVVFLNHGSQGACPRPVFQAYQDWQLELERQPIEFGRKHGEAIHEARRALAEYVGAEPDNLVYVVNATFGLNIIARSLRLQPGDQVLSTDHAAFLAVPAAIRFLHEHNWPAVQHRNPGADLERPANDPPVGAGIQYPGRC